MEPTLLMKVWDVSHGNALYIRTPSGKHLVFDLGKGSYAKGERFSPVKHLRRTYQVKQLDLLVLTHPHLDHIEDILSIRRTPIHQIILPYHLTRKDFITDRIRRKDIPTFEAYAQLSEQGQWQNQWNDEEVSIQFFRVTEVGRSRMNDHSVISVLTYLGHRLVLTGDNEELSLKRLMKDAAFRQAVTDCDVLLAPHHGRKHGFYEPFVKLCSPRLTLISDGRPGHTALRKAYGTLSRGLAVRRGKRGLRRTRNTISTNADGVITLVLGLYQNTPQLKVTTNKTPTK